MRTLLDELDITLGTRSDWPYFARWHYRSPALGPSRFITLLWHGRKPVGICIFGPGPLSLAARNRYFGRSGRWSRLTLRAMNRQLVCLTRIVLHPSYRGIGAASAFLRQSCAMCPFDWIETMSELGRIHPLFERAGFQPIETPPRPRRSRLRHSDLFGVPTHRHTPKRLISPETNIKSQHANPLYFIRDNRNRLQPKPWRQFI